MLKLDGGLSRVEKLLLALRAVAEPTRLRLVALCARGDLTVSELVHILGQNQPRISRHLKLLTDAGVFQRFREGAWVFHRLARTGVEGEIARYLVSLIPTDDEQLARDQEALELVQTTRAEAAAMYFSRIAPQWDEVRTLYIDEREVEKVLGDMLPDEVNDLLDIGTGTGRILEILAPRTRHAEGIDMSPEMLAVARANLERAGCDNCAVRKADMYRLPFPADSFDAITIHQVLHFADDPARTITEAARILRPGGTIIVGDFAPHDLEYLRDEQAHRRLGFSDTEVIDWFTAAGLTSGKTVHLPGEPLTVTIWQGNRA